MFVPINIFLNIAGYALLQLPAIFLCLYEKIRKRYDQRNGNTEIYPNSAAPRVVNLDEINELEEFLDKRIEKRFKELQINLSTTQK